MKQLLFILTITISLFSCSSDKTSHDVRWSADGKDSVVYVQYQNPQTNQMENFYMNYLMFNMLFNQGGYGNCYNYYHSHPASYNYNTYRTYTPRGNYGQSTGSSYKPSGVSSPEKAYSSPSRRGSSSSSPSRSIWGSGSSSSRSYSSPSRSYSSPSRSYSSPSRSYSSPSRSYSSPSRH